MSTRDGPSLTDCWHARELHVAEFRCTDGDAGLSLPAGGTLEIELGGEMRYRAGAETPSAQTRAA